MYRGGVTKYPPADELIYGSQLSLPAGVLSPLPFLRLLGRVVVLEVGSRGAELPT